MIRWWHNTLFEIKWDWKSGWWITDRKGYRHKHFLAFGVIEAPDGLRAFSITIWALHFVVARVKQ
jgi:hypothetical protein